MQWVGLHEVLGRRVVVPGPVEHEGGLVQARGSCSSHLRADAWACRPLGRQRTGKSHDDLERAREILGTKVTSGSFTQYPLKRGDRIEARVDPLGPVRAEFL